MKKTKFKLGDKVRRVVESSEPQMFGEIYTIYTVSGFYGTGSIKLKELGQEMTGSSDADSFELANENILPDDLFTL